MITGEDWSNDRLTNSFAVIECTRFVTMERSSTLNTLFALPIRVSMSLNAILRYLNFETSCGVLLFTFSNQWHEFLERHNTQVFLGLNFVAAWLHAAENRSRLLWWPCSEDAISFTSSQKSDDPADSSVDTLVNSNVTVYSIHTDCEEEWWKHKPFQSSNTHDEGLWLNAADTETNIWAGIRWLDGQ